MIDLIVYHSLTLETIEQQRKEWYKVWNIQYEYMYVVCIYNIQFKFLTIQAVTYGWRLAKSSPCHRLDC